MNNSLPRLIDGMVATLRREIIPNIEGDFPRGQAYGLIYMLNSLKLRAAWSNAFLGDQLRALDDLSHELETLDLPGAPLPNVSAAPTLPDAKALEAARDAGDARVCELIDWLASNNEGAAAVQARAAIDRYLNRQARHELATSAKPMFVEISSGAENS